MRALVTGGAGFIGSNFVRYVVRELGWEVMVYDKLTYAGRLENLADVMGDIRFVRGDVADESALRRAFEDFRPEVVIHFAAETHVDRSINEPAPFIRTNVLGTFTLLEVMRSLARDSLLVHVSTDEVYGDLPDPEVFADESSPLRPSSPYSASKAAQDMLVMSYGRTYGIRYRIVRPSNNYGPYQHPEKLIPKSIIRALSGRPALVYGRGEQVRDWLYVEDNVRAIVKVAESGDDGEIYNICANQHKTVREVVEMTVKTMGLDPSRYIVYTKDRPGGDVRYAMRCDKVRRLGWEPRVSLEEGLRLTIDWYRNNEAWWRPIIDERYVLADVPWQG